MKPQPPTREFLEELRERARWHGWTGDYFEIAAFIKALYREAGLPMTDADLEPYERGDD